ncbi:MAG: DsbA family protein [Pseudomonadota bacterium]|nr:DsbA family protein [Pseudomonadota bacterium]
MPTYHDNDYGFANCMLIASSLEGAGTDALANRLLEAHWRDDADIADAATLSRLGNEAGVDAARLLAAANSAEVQPIYRLNTAEAIERSVFGSPTYFVDGDMFYGQDHLELVARALVKPFSGTWPLPAA